MTFLHAPISPSNPDYTLHLPTKNIQARMHWPLSWNPSQPVQVKRAARHGLPVLLGLPLDAPNKFRLVSICENRLIFQYPLLKSENISSDLLHSCSWLSWFNAYENHVLAHYWCIRSKGNQTASEASFMLYQVTSSQIISESCASTSWLWNLIKT